MRLVFLIIFGLVMFFFLIIVLTPVRMMTNYGLKRTEDACIGLTLPKSVVHLIFPRGSWIIGSFYYVVNQQPEFWDYSYCLGKSGHLE